MNTQHYRIGEAYIGGFGDGAAPSDPNAILCPAPPRADAKFRNGQWEVDLVTDAELDAELSAIDAKMVSIVIWQKLKELGISNPTAQEMNQAYQASLAELKTIHRIVKRNL